MAQMVENEYNKELLITIKGLAFVAKGQWPGMLDTLSTVLSQFHNRNQEFEFGLNSWPFVISAIRPFQPKPDHNEYMWPVVTAWLGEQQKADYPDRPYGKIFATRIAKGWRLELWHNGVSSDPTATEVYMGGLFQALVEDGLQPVDTLITTQSESAGGQGNTTVTEQRKQPVKPSVGAAREEWYMYKWKCNRSSDLKFTHADLANALNLSKGTVRNYYSTWKAEIGENDDTI